MADNRNYGKQVVLSLIITLVVLAAAVLGFAFFLLPKYQITTEQIYDIAVKLFPILIGLVMIQAGVVVAHRRDEDYADEMDKLPPNAYDKPLHVMPNDDPSTLSAQQFVATQAPVSVPVVPASPKVEEEKVSVQTVVRPETIDASFDSIFKNELQSAQDFDYDITLALVSVNDEYKEKLEGKFSTMITKAAYAFIQDDGTSALVFPFFNMEEVNEALHTVMDEVKTEFAEVKVGCASRNGRILTTDILMNEAKNNIKTFES